MTKRRIKYQAISPNKEILLIDTPLSVFAKKMGWNVASFQTSFHSSKKYKGWNFSYYHQSSPDIYIDQEKLNNLKGVQFVFRVDSLGLYWNAYIYPDLKTLLQQILSKIQKVVIAGIVITGVKQQQGQKLQE